VNGAGRPVPRNPASAASAAPAGEAGSAPGAPPPARAARPLPTRGEGQGAAPGALWALFPLAFAVAVLAGVWDCRGSGAPLSAEETLRRFYLRLSEGDLAGAHAYLSSEARRELPRPRFDDGWRSVRRVTLLGASPLPAEDASGVVRLRACVEVLHQAAQGEQRVLYQGQVTLPREGQDYRVGPSALSPVHRC
jgi:hypothetical protein